MLAAIPRSVRCAVVLLSSSMVYLGLVSQVRAADDEQALEFFEKKIRPVLVERCYKCHSAETKSVKGGLRVDSRDALRVGGDSGAAVVPGNLDESLLLSAISYSGEFYDMPPDGKLDDGVIADFRRWIELGAADPRGGDVAPVAKPAGIDLEAGRQFWAFQPPRETPPPVVSDNAWPADDLDRYLLAELEAKGLQPARDTDRATLLRRLSFDLIGLPPTLEELRSFEQDQAPGALERVVDRLLDSPHFGERWGRYWLDVARYAESSGGGRSMVFKQAWRYRDYVIRAFNEDKPYDRFIAEQVAGDLLPYATQDEHADQLTATAYLVLGPINYEEQDKDLLDMDIADEQIDTIGRSVLGMTIGCARCHDHKFDPIPTRDYYALAGILRSTHVVNHENVSVWTEMPLPMAPKDQAAWNEYEAEAKRLDQQIKLARTEAKEAGAALAAAGPATVNDFSGIVLDDEQAQKVGDWRLSTSVKSYIGGGYLHDADSDKGAKTITFSPRFAKAGMYEVRLAYAAGGNRATEVPVEVLHVDGEFECVINEQEVPPIDARWVSLGTFRFDPSNQWYVMVANAKTAGHVVVDAVQFVDVETNESSVAKRANTESVDGTPGAAAAARVRQLESRKKALAKRAPARPLAMAVEEAKAIGDCQICIRGNVQTRGDVAPRGFLSVASTAPAVMPAGESGRRELADWLTSRDNPLAARVMANRIWSHLFGVGIVRTVDNFGSTGEMPSNIQLLDHLALKFIEAGWSTKALIRQIVLSRAYRMSTDDNRAAHAIDPENRLVWRMNRRRLDAEALRDAILAVSGQLDTAMYGRTMKFDSATGLSADGEYGYQFDDARRSIYTPVFRNRLNELFEVFDFADPNGSTGQRNTSTVAPQALFLLNNAFVIGEARRAAEAELARSAAGDDERIDRAFRTTLSRLPSDAERQIVRGSLEIDDDAASRRAAWEQLYQALFACIDFRYLD